MLDKREIRNEPSAGKPEASPLYRTPIGLTARRLSSHYKKPEWPQRYVCGVGRFTFTSARRGVTRCSVDNIRIRGCCAAALHHVSLEYLQRERRVSARFGLRVGYLREPPAQV
ncbi:Nicotinate phosphoribosyltransferase [Frankliniella fusca]|uniref:Nicotinate phosphoribosyltransferase n=1 Tax=Frankliniella fusca TaxID=407009 RepID=A0AAE1LC33_9NEOP|nr:Nicotinate phosphoribosyltransferase [Frankliniella fusca]